MYKDDLANDKACAGRSARPDSFDRFEEFNTPASEQASPSRPAAEPKQAAPKKKHVPRVFTFSDYSIEVVRTMPEHPYCGDERTSAAICEQASLKQYAAGVEQEHTARGVKRSCHRPTCASCGDDVIKQRAVELRDKVNGVRRLFLEEGVRLDYNGFGKDKRLKSCYAVELILSPPASEYGKYQTFEGYGHMWRTAAEFARKIGMVGGISAMHPVRGEHEVIEAYMEGRIELDFSPHYHFICYMPKRHLINSDAFMEMTGWFYKVVPKWEWGKFKKSLFRKIEYELDHACVSVHRIIRDNKYGEEVVVQQHSQLDRHHGILHHSTVKKVEVYEYERCKTGDGGYVYLWNVELNVRADNPVEVLKERYWVFRDKGFQRSLERFGLRVRWQNVPGSHPLEPLPCWNQWNVPDDIGE